MKERPILFSGDMVRAILEGRKTQTRRVIKNSHLIVGAPAGGFRAYECHDESKGVLPTPKFWGFQSEDGDWKCPFGKPGDRLWVRETWAANSEFDGYAPRDIPQGSIIEFAAEPSHFTPAAGKVRPSIFMPRWASRITLEIVDIRVERLQDISDVDSVSEGILWDEGGDDWPNGHSGGGYKNYLSDDDCFDMTPNGSYMSLWESINGTGSWEQNPYVWVVEFKRI